MEHKKNTILTWNEVSKYNWEVSLLHFYHFKIEEGIYKGLLKLIHTKINLFLKLF